MDETKEEIRAQAKFEQKVLDSIKGLEDNVKALTERVSDNEKRLLRICVAITLIGQAAGISVGQLLNAPIAAPIPITQPVVPPLTPVVP